MLTASLLLMAAQSRLAGFPAFPPGATAQSYCVSYTDNTKLVLRHVLFSPMPTWHHLALAPCKQTLNTAYPFASLASNLPCS
ncbi:hypothetical protein E4U52_007937 [Claviceps spartinae]|nr:hypothetical protein E4U52_007937 [Claviceps spartinae]